MGQDAFRVYSRPFAVKFESISRMKTFPINVKLAGLPVLMVGGGAMAAEKLEKLMPHHPRLTLVSPQLDTQVEQLVAAHGIHCLREPYAAKHLKGHRLVYAAAEDLSVNRQVYADTRGMCMLVNAVDMPDCCDFIMPAVVSGEHFSIAISTGGTAAGYARQLREQLEAAVQQEDDIVKILEQIRAVFKRKVDTFAARRERLWEILRELEGMERNGSAQPCPPASTE